MSGFVQALLCEGMLIDEDTWELPNSVDKKPRSISGRGGCADFLKQPYSPISILMRKKTLWVQICPWKVYSHLQGMKK